MTSAYPVPRAEPLLDGNEIQGNVLPGFFKPHMALLAMNIHNLRLAKRQLTVLAPSITTLAQAMVSRIRVRACEQDRMVAKARALCGEIPNGPEALREAGVGVDDVWLNIAFSYRALRRLLPTDRRAELTSFSDDAFRLGMATRSAMLGDPTDPTAEGSPNNWIVGGAHGEPDLLLILAADDKARLNELRVSLLDSLPGPAFDVTYEEYGHKLDAIGTEHFGFQDGISQPGVRGYVGPGPNDYLTPRTIAHDEIPETWLYGLPGQYLVWPGEFVFGYPGHGSDPLIAGSVKLPGPDWSLNGSYLAFRRLRQDVAGFRDFLHRAARTLAGHGIDAERLAAQIVGRWPSGAPVARTPDVDIPELGIDRLRNNYFEFGTDARTLQLIDGGDTEQGYPSAEADPLGLSCPMFAHIRKVNTRSAPNDAGGRIASFTRRILRRGLPYGPRYDEDPTADRGLLFLSYQTSIVDQFEFLHRRWMGSYTNPHGAAGHDLLVGQNGQPGEERVRVCTIESAAGAVLSTPHDYVIPTGGGYFFTPSISVIRDLLGG